MKEALFYYSKEDIVYCELCPKKCKILDGNFGDCNVRKNVGGKLYSTNYGKFSSMAIDPIEKKPLYHFLPGSKTFSFGTVGCNLHCKHCQNSEISQINVDEFEMQNCSPKKVVELAIKNNCDSISYTYNEPIVFYEFVLATAKLARKNGLKNILVSNGFINKKPLEQLCKYLDATNIDLKSFNDKTYRSLTSGWLSPILDSLKILKENNIWLEITNLIIPKINDSKKEIEEMISWIKKNLGSNVPLHFTAFYPCYNLLGEEPTSPFNLVGFRNLALKKGLEYIYMGNIADSEGSNTYCLNCKKLLIKREGYNVQKLFSKKCDCGCSISGVW